MSSAGRIHHPEDDSYSDRPHTEDLKGRGGGYVTPFGKFPPNPNTEKANYQNIRPKRELRPSLKYGQGVMDGGQEEGLKSRAGQIINSPPKSAMIPPVGVKLPGTSRQVTGGHYQSPSRHGGPPQPVRETLEDPDPGDDPPCPDRPRLYTPGEQVHHRPQKRSEFDPPSSIVAVGSAAHLLQEGRRFVPKPFSGKVDPLDGVSSSSVPPALPSPRNPVARPALIPDEVDYRDSRGSGQPVPTQRNPPQLPLAPTKDPLEGDSSHSLVGADRPNLSQTGFLNKVSTTDQVLHRIIQQCETAMGRYPKQVADGRLVFVSDRFACGMFDHRGGYLTLPFYKTSLFVTPHAVVGDDLEPIYLYVRPESSKGLLGLAEDEEAVSSTITCGNTGLKFSSDVVLSFPLVTKDPEDPNVSIKHQIIVSEKLGSSEEKPKHQVMDKVLDCFYNIADDRCTVMVNQLSSFTVITKKTRNEASMLPCPNPSPRQRQLLTLRVGVFGRQLVGSGSAQIRVIFWSDSEAETQRIFSEESQDRFSKLDLVRAFTVHRTDRKSVRVRASHVMPGWTLLTRSTEKLSLENLLSQHRQVGCPPSCTFALYKDDVKGGSGSLQTPRSATCSIDVSQDFGDEDEAEGNESDSVKFVAVVDEQVPAAPNVPSRLPKAGKVAQQKVSQAQTAPVNYSFTPLSKPPACLAHKTLGELSLHLQVVTISGRGWKLLAQKMGLSAPHICFLSERYLCPGQALLNWYLGQQVALIPTREAIRRLLDLFREMEWTELQTIMTREFQSADRDQADQGLEWNTPKQQMPYETIDENLLPSSTAKACSKKPTPPVPVPRSSPKAGPRRTAGKIPPKRIDVEEQGFEGEQQDKVHLDPNEQFKSQGSEKVVTPNQRPTGFPFQLPLTSQLPKRELWSSKPLQLQPTGTPNYDSTPSSEIPQIEDRDMEKEAGVSEKSPCASQQDQEVSSTHQLDKEATADVMDEDPYLRPVWKGKMKQPRHLDPLRKTGIPTPPKRTSSARVRTREPRTKKISPEASPLFTLSGRADPSPGGSSSASGSKQAPQKELPMTPDKSQSHSGYQVERFPPLPIPPSDQDRTQPEQNPASSRPGNDSHTRSDEQAHLGAAFQEKLKGLQGLVKKNFHVMMTRGSPITEETTEEPIRRRRHSLDGPIPETIYDEVDCLLQENKDAESADDRRLWDKFKQQAVGGLLSKISNNAGKKRPPPLPSRENRPHMATNDRVCYEDVTGPDDFVSVNLSSDKLQPVGGGTALKKGGKPKPPNLDPEPVCYEDINTPSTEAPVTPSRLKMVATTTGELRTVRKFVPPKRSVAAFKPEETYEVIPIGQLDS